MSDEKKAAGMVKAYYRGVLRNVSDFREYLQVADSAIRRIGEKQWGIVVLKRALALAATDEDCHEVFELIGSLEVYGRI
ncbi:MAG: hypothetical protein GXP32_02380 [Kiritimatiellaeota bacterium]|nr:hypothetical protein [Kiritimatiellota bacterium]